MELLIKKIQWTIDTVAKQVYHSRYIHFFITGTTGVVLNLALTWFFTEFVFGLPNYFYAYLIGLSANLTYNFVLNTKITFKTKLRHMQRFIIYVIYSLIISAVQAWLVSYITPLVGLSYYLIVIATIIFIFSIGSFIICKLIIFKEQ